MIQEEVEVEDVKDPIIVMMMVALDVTKSLLLLDVFVYLREV